MSIINHSGILHNTNTINMDIYEIAHAKIDTDWVDEHVCSGYTRIYMIIDGRAKISHKDTVITMRPGNIYIIPSGVDFSYCCDKYMEKLYFHVGVTFLEGYDLLKELNSFIILENMSEIILKMKNYIFDNSIYSFIAIKSCLYNIINESIVNSDLLKQPVLKYSPIVKNTLKYIQDNLSVKLLVSEIADKMYISSSKLQKTFKNEVGVSIGKYIDDSLMFIAEQELRKGKKSLKEISDMLGYCDQFYFSRKFSKKYGIAPLKYKNKLNF